MAFSKGSNVNSATIDGRVASIYETGAIAWMVPYRRRP